MKPTCTSGALARSPQPAARLSRAAAAVAHSDVSALESRSCALRLSLRSSRLRRMPPPSCTGRLPAVPRGGASLGCSAASVAARRRSCGMQPRQGAGASAAAAHATHLVQHQRGVEGHSSGHREAQVPKEAAHVTRSAACAANAATGGAVAPSRPAATRARLREGARQRFATSAAALLRPRPSSGAAMAAWAPHVARYCDINAEDASHVAARQALEATLASGATLLDFVRRVPCCAPRAAADAIWRRFAAWRRS